MFSTKVAIALCALATIAVPAFAQDATKSDGASSFKRAGHHRGGKGFNPLSKLSGNLALTPDQQQKIESIKTQAKSQIEPKREQLVAAKKTLRELMSANELDRSKVEAAHDQLQSQKAAIEKIRFNSMLSIRTILTPEQRASLKAQMSNRFKGATPADKG
jgi:Spy/CpxP family protein refolding chaperone